MIDVSEHRNGEMALADEDIDRIAEKMFELWMTRDAGGDEPDLSILAHHHDDEDEDLDDEDDFADESRADRFAARMENLTLLAHVAGNTDMPPGTVLRLVEDDGESEVAYEVEIPCGV